MRCRMDIEGDYNASGLTHEAHPESKSSERTYHMQQLRFLFQLSTLGPLGVESEPTIRLRPRGPLAFSYPENPAFICSQVRSRGQTRQRYRAMDVIEP